MKGARIRMRPRLAVLLILAAAAGSPFGREAAAQAGAPASPPAGGDYAGEAVVIQKLETRVVFEADGTSTTETAASARIQSEAGVKALEVLTFPYQQGRDAVDVEYVRVRHPDGTVTSTPSTDGQDLAADVSRTAPMYSDVHEKHLAVRSLGVGDALEYAVRLRRSTPDVPGEFWFSYNFSLEAITEDERLEVTVPREKYVRVSSPGHEAEIRQAGDRTIYAWRSNNLEHDAGRAREAARRPSVQMTTFHGWQDVGRWYGGLAAPEARATPAIRRKAADLTRGLTSDEAKIRALYDFVSTQVHYISLSFGVGRYQPHAAEQVLANQYGDCKDKHTLLAALLEASGFDASPALVNASIEVDPDLPSPGQFDHVITVVRHAGELWWLDTTPEVAPFRMLTPNLRGKNALVIPRSTPASLMITPDALPFAPEQRFVADGSLGVDGTFAGRIRWAVRGDFEVLLRSQFRGTPQSQWNLLAQRLSGALGFAGDVTSVTAGPPDDTSRPFEFSYEYTRRKLGDWDNRRIMPLLPAIGIETDPNEKAATEPIELGAPGQVTYRSAIELPPGATVVLPPPVHVSDAFAGYDATYRFDGRVLTVERVFTVKRDKVPVDAQVAFRPLRQAVTDDERTFIGLGGVGSSADPGTTAVADRLYREGIEAMGRHDAVGAQESFQRLVKVAPDYRGAHAALGASYLTQGNDAGIAELRKEEELHPDDAAAFEVLARYFQYKGQSGEALEQWQAVLRLQPKNRDAAGTVGQLLVGAKRYEEAIAVLQAALAAAPDSPSLHFAAAQAFLYSGRTDSGVAEFQKAIALDPSAGVLNDAAYALADRAVFLDQAKDWATQALTALASASAGTTLATLQTQDLRRTNSFAAYWDTLGWTCLRRGELDAAERYLRAAWNLSQSAVQGDHLAQVYERNGDAKTATAIYELAYASAAPAGKDDIVEHYRKLTGRDRPAGADPRGELVRMRTVKLPTITPRTATAEFFILVSAPGRIEDARFITGSDELKDAGRILVSVKLQPVFPGDQSGKLVRRAVVSCGATGCDLVFMLPATVRTVD